MNPRQSSVLFLAALFGPAVFSPLSAADQSPQAIFRPAPVYPFELRKAEFEGAVLVTFNVTAHGDVANAAVVGSTHQVFEEPTLNAIRKWKFTPGRKDGVAVCTPASQFVTFTVPTRNPETPTTSLTARLRPSRSTTAIASAR